MTLTTALYLVEIIENINQALGFIFGALIIAMIICSIALIATFGDDDDLTLMLKKPLKLWWVLLLLIIISIPIPSKSTMYMMLGTKYLEQSNLPSKVSQALELKLDDYIKVLKEKK